MYKLLICHRRRPTMSSARFHRHFHEQRAVLVRQVRSALGYASYAQLHQSSRINPFYQGILLTRSRLVTGLLSVLQRLPWPRTRSGTAEPEAQLERWDVVEEFSYASERAMLEALQSATAKVAVERLVRDQRGVSRLTVVVVAETFQVVADPMPRVPRVKNFFFLRALPEWSHDDMLQYWGSAHKQLFASFQRELRYAGYEQLHVRRSPELTQIARLLGGRPVHQFDAVAGVTYAGERQLALDFISLTSQAANLRLVKDEVRFIDGQSSLLVYGQSQLIA